MKTGAKTLLIAVVISAVMAVGLIGFLRMSVKNTDIPENSNLMSFETTYSDNKIFIDMVLKKPESCETAIKEFSIEPIYIKKHLFVPTCENLSDTELLVTFSEVTPV
jgi:hypothetical protein